MSAVVNFTLPNHNISQQDNLLQKIMSQESWRMLSNIILDIWIKEIASSLH
ncbi:hypothetical protein [Pantoea sp. Mhis]|uniref:hypothetical protein n=1 Tax=Pantoea sp. Mhis TaxID=2576759 RepID=UPI00135806AE|nr:hypothetical protein [Pantoea sp. Mhis]